MFGGRYYTINLLTCEKARGTNILNISLSFKCQLYEYLSAFFAINTHS